MEDKFCWKTNASSKMLDPQFLVLGITGRFFDNPGRITFVQDFEFQLGSNATGSAFDIGQRETLADGMPVTSGGGPADHFIPGKNRFIPHRICIVHIHFEGDEFLWDT